MKHTKIKLSELNSFSDCFDAIDLIERDYLNIIGGRSAWMSGRQTYLTDAAEKKVAAIKKRAERLLPDDDYSDE